MKTYLTARNGTTVLIIFSILTFCATFLEIDITCNAFCSQILYSAPAPEPQQLDVRSLTNENAAKEQTTKYLKHPFQVEEVEDLHIIKYPVPETFKDFQDRKVFLKHACQYASSVYEKSKTLTHEKRMDLQREIQEQALNKNVTQKDCIPALPNRGSKLGHFYNDTYKFSICLPTKTGSTNWLKGLVSLVKDDIQAPEHVSERDTWYGLDRFPPTPGEAMKFRKGRSSDDGYMTFVTVRHPLARLYSAWHDKFRKGHPWLKPINKNYGPFLRKLERKDMRTENEEYSFEAFLELAAVSDFDFQRDRHWQTFQFYCGTCNFDYDFIIKNEDAFFDNKFIIWSMGVQGKTHVPGKYKGAVTMEKMLEPYRNVSAHVIKQIYRNYFSDFVFFNYTIDDALAIADHTPDKELDQVRLLAHMELKKKFLPFERTTNEETCDPPITDYYEYMN